MIRVWAIVGSFCVLAAIGVTAAPANDPEMRPPQQIASSQVTGGSALMSNQQIGGAGVCIESPRKHHGNTSPEALTLACMRHRVTAATRQLLHLAFAFFREKRL